MTAPRIEHNQKLADDLISRLRVSGRYPMVVDQQPVFPIEPGHLIRFGYNPAILEEGGTLLMAYRYHDGDTFATRLALAQLDLAGKVLSNRSIDSAGKSMEDPRLFMYRGAPHLCWVESSWPNMPITAVVKYGRLEDGKLVSQFEPKHRSAKPIEKNWVPIVRGDSLFFIYDSYPSQEVIRVEENEVKEYMACKGWRWPYGSPRGGAVVEFSGLPMRFFHSSYEGELGQPIRRYFVGAALIRDNPPFEAISVTPDCLLFGSERDRIPVADWQKCLHRKPRVVFPGGAVARERDILLSVGVNDSACEILAIPNQAFQFKTLHEPIFSDHW